MRGPYQVTKVLLSGRYELKLLSGARGKTTQAAAQFMILWKGEWCPDSCAAFFEDAHYGDNDVTMAGPSYTATMQDQSVAQSFVEVLKDEAIPWLDLRILLLCKIKAWSKTGANTVAYKSIEGFSGRAERSLLCHASVVSLEVVYDIVS